MTDKYPQLGPSHLQQRWYHNLHWFVRVLLQHVSKVLLLPLCVDHAPESFCDVQLAKYAVPPSMGVNAIALMILGNTLTIWLIASSGAIFFVLLLIDRSMCLLN